MVSGVMPKKNWNRLSHERALWGQGVRFVAGADEAGCGPLAGPVVAAAVMFPSAWGQNGLDPALRGLDDSKQLTEEERERFFRHLTDSPEILFAISVIDVETIDRINIRQAAWRGMSESLDRIQPKPEHALIDGLRIKWLAYPQTAIPQGDAKSYTIAAASVLAKVTRDRLMQDLDAQFPGYGFAAHKGYPTPQHLAAIKQLGPCPVHRRSFAPFRPVELELDFGPAPHRKP
jgi:ribonuclease HII